MVRVVIIGGGISGLSTAYYLNKAGIRSTIIEPQPRLGGVIRNETATTVTLRQPGGAERTIARNEIATMKTSSQSFMPEGLEAGLSQQDIADLIEFLFEPGH